MNIGSFFALKKNESIQQKVVKNRKLSLGDQDVTGTAKSSQKCGASRCMTCPLLFDLQDNVIVNGIQLVLDPALNCKSKNVIYLAQCKICHNVGLDPAGSTGCKDQLLMEDS